MYFRFTGIVAAIAIVHGVGTSVATAQVNISFTNVGNAGNAGDPNAFNRGGVAYDFRIGRFEVTNSQYTAFLNTVAASDPNSLYNTNMGTNARGGIARTGTAGSFSYSVRPNMGDKPVNFVSFWMGPAWPTGLPTGRELSVPRAASTH
jgi:formylglycine-generating enzyme